MVWNTSTSQTNSPEENQGLTYSGGLATPQFSPADINGDGTLDLFIYDSYSQRQFWLDGSTAHQKPVALSNPFPIAQWVKLVDYNCDGIPDLFTGQNGGVRVHQGRYENEALQFGDGQLIQSSYQLTNNTFTANIFVNPIDIPVIQDMDGDGDIDLLATASSGDRVEHHTNTSMETSGTCGLTFKLTSGCYGYFRENDENATIALGQDKCPIAVSNRASLKHSGTTLFLDQDQKTLVLGELEYDSLKVLDLVAGLEGDSAVAVSLFPKDNPIAISAFNAVYAFLSAEKSGYIVAPNASSGFQTQEAIQLLTSNADGNISVSNSNFLVENMADFGIDAQLTHASIQEQEHVVVLSFKRTRTQSFQEITVLEDLSSAVPNKRCVIPVNLSQSLTDIAVAGDFLYATTATGEILSIPANWDNCTLNFSAAQTISLSPTPSLGTNANLLATDINNDQHTDLILGGTNGQVSLYLGTENGTFTAFTTNWEALRFPSSPYIDLSLQHDPGNHFLWISQFSGRMLAYKLLPEPPFIDTSTSYNLPPNAFVGIRPSLLPLHQNQFLAGTASGGLIQGELIAEGTISLDDIRVFPNPNTGSVRFNTAKILRAVLLDTQGKILTRYAPFIGNLGIAMDTAPGMYYLGITDAQGNQRTFKIVVLNNE